MTTIAAQPHAPTASPAQQCLAAFCSPAGPEVFHSIVRPDQIWTPDPFDVETIHHHARELFQRLLHRATMPADMPSGRLFLLEGESGSGKSHLMRAFRSYTHANERGYFSYLQMTSQASSYAGYVLAKLIDALDQPYRPPEVQTSGLMRLAVGLLEAVPGLGPHDVEGFRDGQVADLPTVVDTLADRLLGEDRFAALDLDLLRALLFLARNDASVKARVLKWLRCEDLSSQDRKLLGDLVPRPQEEAPQRMIAQLGQLMAALHGMPLVLCVDQLEDMADMNVPPERFRKVMNTLIAIADEVPTAVVVISCLEDYFQNNKQLLPGPKLDRIENDPKPIRLMGQRTLDEIQALVARRLQVYYDEMDVPAAGKTGTFPFTKAHLAALTNMRTRDVLDYCREHRDRCVLQGHWIEPSGAPAPTPSLAAPKHDQHWNDFLAGFKAPVPDDENGLAGLLAWAIKHCSDEMPPGCFFGAEADERLVQVDAHASDNDVDRLLVAVCDKRPQGGGLGKQIQEAAKVSGEVPLAVVRSTAFPTNPKADVTKQLGTILKKGGRKLVVENSDWRAMLAFRQFRNAHEKDSGFPDWARASRPLSQLAALRRLLNLDSWPKPPTTKAPVTGAPQPAPPAKAAPPPPVGPVEPISSAEASAPLLLGTKAGVTGGAVNITPQELTQHAAFLGGSGSGKTTVALNLIEQLLERGIPAVLLDRKGDLCRYADPAAWATPLADAEQAARRQRLRDRLEVAVFTPGQPSGRPLTIPVVPSGLKPLATLEREQLAGYAAAALGSMIGYKPKGPDQARLAILRKAIEVLGSIEEDPVSVPKLRQLIDDRDDALMDAVDGGFEDKFYKKLSEELLTLWLQHKHLLAGQGERLDMDVLLGRGAHARAGKTRLSVISTHFLKDAATVDFWVAQLLLTVARWLGRHPAKELQAVFLFDEADLYLPALRQPATKAPMENLLKRARSAGVGLLLATQSPGDFDYKCRDTIRSWLVGRVKEQTALNKLRPMFADSKVDVAAKLPSQETGQFHLLREKEVCALTTRRSLISTEQLPEERILELARASGANDAHL